MKPRYLFGSFALIPSMIGCAPVHSRITGVFSPVAGKFAPGEFSDVRVDGRPLYPELKPYSRIETEQLVKIRVSQLSRGSDTDRNYNYNVLLGPVPGSGRTAEGWLKNTEPVMFLYSGAMFMWGQNLQAQSKWVSAASIGSTIVIQTVEDENLERVFFLNGGSITVTARQGTAPPKKWIQPNTYIEYPAAPISSFPTERSISTSPEVCPFIQEVAAAARAAGWVGTIPACATVPDD